VTANRVLTCWLNYLMTQCKESDTCHDAVTAAAAGPAGDRSTPTDYDGFVLSLQYDSLTD